MHPPLPARNTDYHTARILDEIHKDQEVTQRKLSSRVGIALGVTNSYIRRLVRKGHLKVTTLPRNRLKYFVTPSGIALKAKLTYEYLAGSMDFYRQARSRAAAILETMGRQGVSRVAFLGLGDLAEIVYLSLQETSIRFVGVFDDAAAGQTFFKTAVRPEDELAASGAERIIYTKSNWTGDRPYQGRLQVTDLFEDLKPRG